MSTPPVSTAPLVFTGVSTFSNDFQTILQHAQQVGQIPIQQLQNQQANILQQKQLLISLGPVVGDLATSLTNLGSLAANQALSATSSDTTTVTVTNTGATAPASYTIANITSLATAASETSTSGYANSTSAAVSSTGALNLVVGSKTYPLSLTSETNNLNGLVSAINNLGAGVTASVLTTGNATNPDYLSISASATGATTLQLIDNPSGTATNLITASNQGKNAAFQFNGIPVSRPTNQVNDLVQGLSFNLVETSPTGSVNLTLATDPTQLSSGLSDFAAKYNALLDQVNQQVGPGAGLLSGDFIVTSLESDLQQLASYQGNSSSIRSLSDLGLTFDDTGHLSFDPTVFSSLSPNQVSDAFKFLGSSTTGFGALAQTFTQLSDPVTGLIRTQEDGYTNSINNISSQVQTLTDQLNASQTALQAKLAAADTLVASMQSQQNTLSASIQSLNFVMFGQQQQQAGGSSGISG